MKKILFFQPNITTKGGIESWLDTLLPALKETHRVYTLSAYDKAKTGESFSLNETSAGKALKPLSRARALAVFVKEHQIDTVIASADGIIIAAILSKLFYKNDAYCIAVVHQEIARTSFVYRILMKFLLPKTDLCVCVSEGIQKEILSVAPATNVITIPNAINTRKNREQSLSILPEKDAMFFSDVTFVSVGRLEYPKAHYRLVESFKRVHEETGANLVIIGEGSLRKVIEKRIKELELDHAVALLGTRANVFPYLIHAKALIQPSYFESFGITVAEALSVGKRVIVSDCHFGPREILGVTDKVIYPHETPYGWLVPVPKEGFERGVGNDQLTKALLLAVQSSEDTQEACKKRSELFDISIIKQKWLDVLG